jgi:2,5-diketo-D-gluconate reductase A
MFNRATQDCPGEGVSVIHNPSDISVPWIEMNDGNRIPQLGFGLSIPRRNAVGTVIHGLSVGYRLLDTAAGYRTERDVREGIKGIGMDRKELFITTKLSNHGRDVALRSFERSLTQLGTDYVDLYLIHFPYKAQNRYVETWNALTELKNEHRARSIGVSNFQIDELDRIIEASGVPPAINQVELHPRFQQSKLRQFHSERGIVTEAYSPLGGGTAIQDPVIRTVASHCGRTPAQIVLRWHVQLGNVVIPRSVSRERLIENSRIFDFELAGEDMRRLAELDIGDRRGTDPASVAGPTGMRLMVSELAERHPAFDAVIGTARQGLSVIRDLSSKR